MAAQGYAGRAPPRQSRNRGVVTPWGILAEFCKYATTSEEPQAMPVPLYQAKAEFFRTLGHPARIRVLELLAERDHAVHELLDRIEIEPSNLSQQLAVLRRAGLVVQRREGA